MKEDFTPEFVFTDELGRRVEVEKMGGGTVGQLYTGSWYYRVTELATGNVLLRGYDFENAVHTGTPHTHEETAKLILTFL